MSTDIKLVFEFGRDRSAPKGAPSWYYRCACGSEECNRNVFGPFKTGRGAEQAAEAFTQSIVNDFGASTVDGGNAQH
jgi:hypothetical protein